MPGDPTSLKLDVVVLNHTAGKAFVVDVTVSFEGARLAKVKVLCHWPPVTIQAWLTNPDLLRPI